MPNQSNAGSREYKLLGRDHWDHPLTVSRRHFKRFSHKIDRSLAALVEQWQHLASPAAQCFGTRFGRTPKSGK